MVYYVVSQGARVYLGRASRLNPDPNQTLRMLPDVAHVT